MWNIEWHMRLQHEIMVKDNKAVETNRNTRRSSQNALKTIREARENTGMPMTHIMERVEDGTCIENAVDAIVIEQICEFSRW